jgi:hypothetical protein
MAARAAALFTSDLSAGSTHTHDEVAQMIRRAVRVHGGTRGCVQEVAAAYGDYPETAAPRMRWALAVVLAVYSRPVAESRLTRRSVRGFHWSARPVEACPTH